VAFAGTKTVPARTFALKTKLEAAVVIGYIIKIIWMTAHLWYITSIARDFW